MNKKRIKKGILLLLSIFVALTTVVVLILPATALTSEAADEDPGINLGTVNNSETQTDYVSKDNTEPVDNNNQETVTGQNSVAVAEEKEPLKFYGEAGDSIVYVEASYDAFPEGTTMEVKEVILNSEQYDSINDQIKDKEVKVLKALDITFRDRDNNEIEPKDNSKVKVSITDKELSELDNAFVAHIDDKEDSPSIIEDVETKQEDVEVLTNTEEITEIVENNDSIDEITVDNTVTFETDSFSLYVLAYTVDFYYGEYEYHLEGGSEIGLIQLFNKLGIDFNIDDVESVTFSDPDLVAVYQVEGNWILSSKQAFDNVETLTVKLKDGGEIVVRVEDVQTYTDLSYFTTRAEIYNAVSSTTNEWTVYENKDYSFQVWFEENADKQFDNLSQLTYNLPDGLNIQNVNGTIDIVITTAEGTYTIKDNPYSISDGVLTFSFNQSDPHIDELKNSSNVGINFSFYGSIDSSTTSLNFGNAITKGVTVTKPKNTVTVSKNGWMENNGDHRGDIKYTIYVTSVGNHQYVKVSDLLSSEGIVSFDNESFEINSNKKQSVSISSYSIYDSSFEYVFDSMEDGEIITITYYGKIDKTKMTDKSKIEFVDNTVKVYSDEDTNEKDSSSSHLNNITYSSISKNYDVSNQENEDRTKTVTWTINANSERYTHLTYISDSLSGENVNYSGDGINVIVTFEDGSTIERNIEWDELVLSSDGKSWIYNLPETDGKASYLITYTTDVDFSNRLDGVTVHNGVADDNASVTNNVNVQPDEKNTFQASKSVVIADNADPENSTVVWTISVNIPQQGYNSLTVTDTYPAANDYFGTFNDLFDDSYPIQINGLKGTETFILDKSSNDHFVLTFFKDSAKTQPGLNSDSDARVLTITFRTKTDPNWIKAYADHSDWRYNLLQAHVNNGKVNANSIEKSVSALSFLDTPQFEKAVFGDGDNYYYDTEIDGVKYRVFTYRILLSQIFDDSILVNDIFDTDLLEYYDDNDTGWFDKNGTISGFENYNYLKTTPMSITQTANGIALSSQLVPKKDDGGYYTQYVIVYKLRAKISDLQRLASNNNGSYSVQNNAYKGELHDDCSVVYNYSSINKEMITKANNSGEYATFRITLNEMKSELNEGKPLVLKDTLTNLSMDYNSIQITTDPFEKIKDISYDMSGSTITYNIPDSTKVVISYRARVIAPGKYKNEAVFNSESKKVEENASQGSEGGGAGTLYSFQILKYKDGDLSVGLPGAVFSFYSPVSSGETADDELPSGIPSNYKWRKDYATDNNGRISVSSSEQLPLFADTNYYLIEKTVPEGYSPDLTSSGQKIAYKVNISSTNTPNYDEFVYFNGDIVKIRNTPLYSSLIINKVFDFGEMSDADKQQLINSINFEITGNFVYGSQKQKKNLTISIPYSSFVDGSYTLTSVIFEENGQMITGYVSKDEIYVVTEKDADINGYSRTTSYSVNSGSSSAESDESEISASVSIIPVRDKLDNEKEYGDGRVTFVNKYLEEDYTATINILKVDDNNVPLSGAKFHMLRKLPGESNYIIFDNDIFIIQDSQNTGMFIINDESGKISIDNLIPGDYKIIEVKAPDGFIIQNDNFTFNISNNGNITYSDNNPDVEYEVDSEGNKTFIVENKAGIELPMTGGSGITVLVLSGISLMFISAIMYFFKMRHKERRLN